MADQYGVVSKIVDVSAQGSFQVAADVTADFAVDHWLFQLDGAAGDSAAISFDGSTVHGYMKIGVGNGNLDIEATHRRVWVKKVTAAGTLKVVVHGDMETC